MNMDENNSTENHRIHDEELTETNEIDYTIPMGKRYVVSY